MKKNYIVDGSFGEISKKLEDQIQDGNKQTLRERSFEELTNFIPKYDYLAETINGVKLEYLIKNEPCKIFCRKLNGYDIIIHIFSDKIITSIPNANKIFVDIIPQNILAEVSSISTCFKINDSGKEKLIFNSIAGIYFCDVIPIEPSAVENGKPYFSKIEIPQSLKGEEIQSRIGNIYYYSGVDSFIGTVPKFLNFPSNPEKNLTLSNLTGYYLQGSNFNIGDIIQANINVLYNGRFLSHYGADIPSKQVIKFKIIESISGVKINNTKLDLIYPSTIKPTKKINITQNTLLFDVVNITNTDYLFDNNFSQIVSLFKLQLLEIIPSQDFNYLGVNINCQPTVLIGGGHLGDNVNKLQNYYLSYCITKTVRYYTEFYSDVANACFPNFNVKIQILQSSINNKVKKLAPYTPYSLAGRLAVSNQNQLKFSKSGNYADFSFDPQTTPTETDAFQRTLQDVDEITFISKWGQLGTQEGFAIGTTREIIFFSSIANIFSTTILSRRNIPCSYITPLDITFASFPATLIVEAGRTRITAVIFTRDQTQEITLTDTIDFFDTDPIAKIQAIKYGRDQMIFALTDSGNLYACLSGSERLAWFRIKLTYKLVDIASFDDGREKKLYIVSSLQNNSAYNLFGSIDFSEGSTQIKAEYFVDNSLQDDNVFDTNSPVLEAGSNVFYKTKEELTNVEKASLPKPIVCKMTLHNQEIITTKYNTKASGTKRKITNTRINVKNANYFSINYITQNISMQPITKLARKIDKINNNLDSERVETLIKVFQESPARDSAKISIETHENSIAPLTIKSISFDTEYVNPK